MKTLKLAKRTLFVFKKQFIGNAGKTTVTSDPTTLTVTVSTGII
ncbi:hypothetical protein [Pedobacter sp. W3I1]|nr:hypothetical protein [Pedobacter sp. W3I1]